MKKLRMCKSLLVTRLTELNQQLATIVKLQKMEDECDKSPVLYPKVYNILTQHTISSISILIIICLRFVIVPIIYYPLEKIRKKYHAISTLAKHEKDVLAFVNAIRQANVNLFINIDIINNYLLLFITLFA